MDPNEIVERLAQFEQLCRQQGVRFTSQRRLVLEALLGREDHPTADQLYEDLRSKMPELSLTTVYRVLETLAAMGVVRKLHHTGMPVRFDARVSRHHHATCFRCGSVVDILDPHLDQVEAPAWLSSEFEVLDHSVQFVGLCKRCRSQAPPKAEESVQKSSSSPDQSSAWNVPQF